MAGIGFALRELTRRDDLLGVCRGFMHAAFAATGPWLFTILALNAISTFGLEANSAPVLEQFRLIVIYNFSFSLVLSGPVLMMATRAFSDLIFERRFTEAPSLLLGTLFIVVASQLPVVVGYYVFFTQLDGAVTAIAIANFLIVSGLWLVAAFVGGLKDYATVSWSFGIGMLVAGILALLLGIQHGTLGLLIGFSGGLAVAFFMLGAKVLAEYPCGSFHPWQVTARLKQFRILALTGFFYNAAIWVDKWIMWFAPEAQVLPSGMVSYPDYDGAMFMAFLVVAPSMAIILVSLETRFFEEYRRFYGLIHGHASLHELERSKRRIVMVFRQSGRNLLLIQGTLSLIAILMAPQLFEWIDASFLQVGMYRLGVLGALFHVMFLGLLIVLSYFDFQRESLALAIVFFVTNAVFTVVSLDAGFALYGYGYFLACIASFLAAWAVTERYLDELPYQAFVRTNPSVRGSGRRCRR